MSLESRQQEAFTGWPPVMPAFFDGLAEHNDRDWFRAHRAEYETAVKEPMERLLASVSEEFGTGHVFRLQRDLRFSADKRPYKERLGAALDAGDSGGHYLHVDRSELLAASGWPRMLPDQLARYRAAVADDRTGSELSDIVAGLRAARCIVGAVVGYRMSGPELTRVPRPHPKDHPREALLRHKSLMAARSWERPAWLHSERARDEVVGLWRTAAPLGGWLARHVGVSESGTSRPRGAR